MIDGWLKLLLLEKMNDGSLLLSINEITHYFKKWTTERKQKTPKELLRLKVLRKSSSLEKVAVTKVTIASPIVYNCSSKISAILYE